MSRTEKKKEMDFGAIAVLFYCASRVDSEEL